MQFNFLLQYSQVFLTSANNLFENIREDDTRQPVIHFRISLRSCPMAKKKEPRSLTSQLLLLTLP